jgi:hypothetical protein
LIRVKSHESADADATAGAQRPATGRIILDGHLFEDLQEGLLKPSCAAMVSSPRGLAICTLPLSAPNI